MSNQAKELWGRVIAKGGGDAAEYTKQLNLLPGASDEELDRLADTLAVVLPPELREFYKVHNGQKWVIGSMCFVRNLTLSPIDQIIHDWKLNNEDFEPEGLKPDIDAAIKPLLWNPRWIPIASNGGGDHVCIDTDPTEEGTVGQVLYFYHDDGMRSVEATGLWAFIELCLTEED